eukprot:2902210-Rhodomonas_salina.1
MPGGTTTTYAYTTRCTELQYAHMASFVLSCVWRYQDESSLTQPCVYHPGAPVFHEGSCPRP